MNGYIAFYKGRKIEILAETSYRAQQIAAEIFKTNKSYDIIVMLVEKEGKVVEHKTDEI